MAPEHGAGTVGLRPPEAAAKCPGGGERIADYAERAGISVNTANTQLKQLLAKTVTNRQADLMRQVLSDPVASLHRAGGATKGS